MDEELCLLPAGEMGRILDRLVLLEQVIGRDHVRQVLEETECFDSRRCRLTREVIFWVVLAMGGPHRLAHSPGLQIRAALAARRTAPFKEPNRNSRSVGDPLVKTRAAGNHGSSTIFRA